MSLMTNLFPVLRPVRQPRPRSWKFSATPTATVHAHTPTACAMTCYWPTKREANVEREQLAAAGYSVGALQPSSVKA